jgi:hypothetical protein
MAVIGDLDHLMILVDDLDAADVALERLGFRPTPRGAHSPAMGTANATVVLRDATYLETLGIVAPTEANAAQQARLALGPGPYGTAFKTDDAAAAALTFAAAGIGDGGAVAFARMVELPEGPREAAFETARSRAGAVPGAWPFAVRHLTPEVVWRPDHLDHPNGALGTVEIVGAARDLGGLARGGAFLGERVGADADAVIVTSATAPLRFLTPDAFAARFGASPGLPEPCLAAVVLRVADLARAADRLTAGGITATVSAGRILVPRVPELGCAFELVASAPAA